VSRPDGQTSKAVADGAIGFYCDHHVGARVAKYMYGVERLREFDETDPEHVERYNRLFQLPSGPKLLPYAFDCILARVSLSMEHQDHLGQLTICASFTEFEGEGVDGIPQEVLHRTHEPLSSLKLRDRDLVLPRTRGTAKVDFAWARWGSIDVSPFQGVNRVMVPEDFSTLCFVRADLSPLAASARATTGEGRKRYWKIVFTIEIHFGLTEFKAMIKWNDDVRFISVIRFNYGLP